MTLQRRYRVWTLVASAAAISAVLALVGWFCFLSRQYTAGFPAGTWAAGVQLGQNGQLFIGTKTATLPSGSTLMQRWQDAESVQLASVTSSRSGSVSMSSSMTLYIRSGFARPRGQGYLPWAGTETVATMSFAPYAAPGLTSPITVNATGVCVPMYLLSLAAAGVAVLAWRRARRLRRMLQPGLCPQCGYDLRASPERCPECGSPALVAVGRPREGGAA